MAWIRVDEDLTFDPRVGLLASRLGVSAAQALGHVLAFRLWASKHITGGRGVGMSPEILAHASLWRGKPAVIAVGLLDAGFIESDGSTVSDWEHFAGKVHSYREREAVRKRMSRGTNSGHTAVKLRESAAEKEKEKEKEKESTHFASLVGPSRLPPSQTHTPGSSIPQSSDRAPVMQRPAKSTEPRIRVVYSERFQDFWRHYPLPVGKGAAFKAWLKAAATVGGEVALLEAIKEPLLEAKASAKWLEEGGRFIPHPSTWLNQRRWEDGL